MTAIRTAILGLDTSHAIEFTRMMQSPELDAALRVDGMRATRCLRFETPFLARQGLDERQRQLEAWGVEVTEDFDRATEDCDAVLIEINDPKYHLEYFERAARLGKPIFLDKPIAVDMGETRKIFNIARRAGIDFFCSSSLRFAPELVAATGRIAKPDCASLFGPLGRAPAGSSILWYGVHTVEMLERIMGTGAKTVSTREDGKGLTAVVAYADGRRGVIELTEGSWVYGGSLRTSQEAEQFVVNMQFPYRHLVPEIEKFFRTRVTPVPPEDMQEVMGLLEAIEKSASTGKETKVQTS